MKKNQTRKRKKSIHKNKHSKCQSLILINGSPLRKQAVSNAKKVLKKISRLEAQITDFHNLDQKLYNDWYNLTFRNGKQEIEELQTQLSDIGRFHNWVLATSEILDIDIYEAYELIKAERHLYLTGDEATRKKIEEQRQKRDEFIFKKIEEDMFGSMEDDFGFDQNDDDIDTNLPPRTNMEEKEFQRIKSLTDKKIKKICKSFEGAFELFHKTFELARDPKDFSTLFRVWEQIPFKTQKALEKSFRDFSGESLRAVLSQLKQIQEEENSFSEQVESHDQDEFEENEFFGGFNTDFLHKGNVVQNNLNPEKEEYLKLIYRKLVRRLHPDLQKDSEGAHQNDWLNNTWLKVQKAFREKDINDLDKLYKVTLLKQKALDELTISDIQEVEQCLERDISKIQFEIREMKKQPAWGFSRKKSYVTITKKIQKDLDREKNSLIVQINEIKSCHEHIEIFIQMNSPFTKKKARRKKANNRKPQRTQKTNHRDQMSF